MRTFQSPSHHHFVGWYKVLLCTMGYVYLLIHSTTCSKLGFQYQTSALYSSLCAAPHSLFTSLIQFCSMHLSFTSCIHQKTKKVIIIQWRPKDDTWDKGDNEIERAIVVEMVMRQLFSFDKPNLSYKQLCFKCFGWDGRLHCSQFKRSDTQCDTDV